ncbi:MAG: hypothetical protein LH628_10400 [Microcoleus sp. CAN_BIN18]|nr:hypothetical protein [Microcoleus sp. CAN_BIN18]
MHQVRNSSIAQFDLTIAPVGDGGHGNAVSLPQNRMGIWGFQSPKHRGFKL